MLSLFKQSLILLFRVVSRLRASSISFESVMNKRSEEPAVVDVGVAGVLFEDLLLLIELTVKLLDNLLKPTSFESISFSNCLACFLKALIIFKKNIHNFFFLKKMSSLKESIQKGAYFPNHWHCLTPSYYLNSNKLHLNSC